MSIAVVADPKGRVTLGRKYAGATLLVEQAENGTLILRPAVTVPSAEAWLWKNKKALASVQAGIEDARRGRRAAAPNMTKAAALARKIKD